MVNYRKVVNYVYDLIEYMFSLLKTYSIVFSFFLLKNILDNYRLLVIIKRIHRGYNETVHSKI